MSTAGVRPPVHRDRARTGPPRLATVLVAVALMLGACTDDASRSTSPSGSETTLAPVAGPFAEGRTPLPGFGEVEVRIVDGPDGEPVVLCVLHATSSAQRQRGLMEVTDAALGGYDGMLFSYDDDHDGGFWMKDTPLPLSIAYVDADGVVVSTADMEPCPADEARCPTYAAARPYRAALEVPRGGLEPLGLTPDGPARVEVGGACAPAT